VADVGELIGAKYLLGRKLGSGGMGEVFEATNVNTGRRVAIKLLRTDGQPRFEQVERFLQEARAASRISHPNVIDVLDLDLDLAGGAGMPYIVQELLTGQSLDVWLEAQPGTRVSAEAALALMLPVMRGLAAAHACGVIHRDLKPSNIFLTTDHEGRVVPKVIDFGIAKLSEEHGGPLVRTATGSLLGTPAFMSPEQASGQTVDAQTDVWAMGVLLYTILSGRHPFGGDNVVALVRSLLHEPLVPLDERAPDVPADVARVIGGALERSREARHPSMAAFVAALEATPTGAAMAPERSRALSLAPVVAEASRDAVRIPTPDRGRGRSTDERGRDGARSPSTPEPSGRALVTPFGTDRAPSLDAVARAALEARGPSARASRLRWGFATLALAVAAGGAYVATDRAGAPTGAVPREATAPSAATSTEGGARVAENATRGIDAGLAAERALARGARTTTTASMERPRAEVEDAGVAEVVRPSSPPRRPHATSPRRAAQAGDAPAVGDNGAPILE
jgi:serine/threonine protein kinase